MNSVLRRHRLQVLAVAVMCVSIWGCGGSETVDTAPSSDTAFNEAVVENTPSAETDSALSEDQKATGAIDAMTEMKDKESATDSSTQPAPTTESPMELEAEIAEHRAEEASRGMQAGQDRQKRRSMTTPTGQPGPDIAMTGNEVGQERIRGRMETGNGTGTGTGTETETETTVTGGASGNSGSGTGSGSGSGFGGLPTPGRDADTRLMDSLKQVAPSRGGIIEGRGGAGFGGGLGGGGGGNIARNQRQAGGEAKRNVEELKKISNLSRLQPGEELWVIARPSADASASNLPGSGSLMARRRNEPKMVPCPLKHTDVNGSIDGYIATVNMKQQFENPFDEKIEAVYTFPLPDSAAVSEFVMTVGDRKIRGIIREKEEAEEIYEAAKNQGHVASLMTQQRANIFTQKVANIEPGHQIDIDIRYFNTLQYDDGAYEFVFPMVVGPRFNPAPNGQGIGAVARGESGTTGQNTDIEYLAPGERSGRDVSVTLTLDAGVAVEDVHSVNHAIDVESGRNGQRTIRLETGDSIPNKDFVFRYSVAGQKIKTALMTHEDQHGKYFTMMLYPPASLQQIERTPIEMVFVVDCSGSMGGKPIGQAKNAIAHCLQNLTPRDSFQIIRFSNDSGTLGPIPLVANEENIEAGLRYLHTLSGSGGTQMIEGIKAALDSPHDPGRFRIVSFMTDGFIGNENEILKAIHDKIGSSRIFSFGVGSAPNRMLMDRMAILGRGAVAYLSLNDDAVAVMDRFKQRICHPAMTDLQIDWGQMDVADVYPKRIPDLIVGRPVIVTGRFKGTPSKVTVNGLAGMTPSSFDVAVSNAGEAHSGVATVWARLKIKDMMNTLRTSPAAAEEIRKSVLDTALNYNLMSSFTAFVAVDSLAKSESEPGRTVKVPSDIPDGVDYSATIPGSEG